MHKPPTLRNVFPGQKKFALSKSFLKHMKHENITAGSVDSEGQ